MRSRACAPHAALQPHGSHAPRNSPHLQLERCGCGGLEAPDERRQAPGPGAPPAPTEGLRVEDPRQLRRRLEAELAAPAAQEAFMAGLVEVVADEAMLRQALLPMVVTSQVGPAQLRRRQWGSVVQRRRLLCARHERQLANRVMRMRRWALLRCSSLTAHKALPAARASAAASGQLRKRRQLAAPGPQHSSCPVARGGAAAREAARILRRRHRGRRWQCSGRHVHAQPHPGAVAVVSAGLDRGGQQH
jgi:hypothetical protein